MGHENGNHFSRIYKVHNLHNVHNICVILVGCGTTVHICDRIWENQPVSEKNTFLFCCFVAFYVE